MREPNFDDRLLKALRCEEPDCVPLLELWIDPRIKSGFLNKPIKGLPMDIEFWTKAGYDCIPLFPGYKLSRDFTLSPYEEGPPLINDKERGWAEEKKGIITTLEEFDNFPWPELKEMNCSMLEEAPKYLPEGMKIIPFISGIFEEVWMLMGFETFSFALVDNPDLVERMFDKIGSFIVSIFEQAAEYDKVGAMWIGDDIAYTSGTMISPQLLRKYLFPWFKKIGDICKTHSLPFIYHSDGNLEEVIPDLIELGINALQPIEPKAMDIVSLKQRYGKKLCFIGNIDIGYTLTRGTPEEVEIEVKERIKKIAPGGGYCVGSSNTVTDYVPLENYKAMIGTTLKFGKYPIELE